MICYAILFVFKHSDIICLFDPLPSIRIYRGDLLKREGRIISLVLPHFLFLSGAKSK
jgi:hypothetical protein